MLQRLPLKALYRGQEKTMSLEEFQEREAYERGVSKELVQHTRESKESSENKVCIQQGQTASGDDGYREDKPLN